MAVETIAFHRKTKGSRAEKEDWWRLNIDSVQGLTVDHEWSYSDVYKGKTSKEGKATYSVAEFLKDKDVSPQGKDALRKILKERGLGA